MPTHTKTRSDPIHAINLMHRSSMHQIGPERKPPRQEQGCPRFETTPIRRLPRDPSSLANLLSSFAPLVRTCYVFRCIEFDFFRASGGSLDTSVTLCDELRDSATLARFRQHQTTRQSMTIEKASAQRHRQSPVIHSFIYCKRDSRRCDN